MPSGDISKYTNEYIRICVFAKQNIRMCIFRIYYMYESIAMRASDVDIYSPDVACRYTQVLVV